MVNKKISKLLGPILGCMGFILAIGVIESPACAEETSQVNSTCTSITTSAAVTLKDYSVNINKSETQNGITVTVDKALATSHNLKVVLKIQSDKPLEKIQHDNSIFDITYGNGDFYGHARSSENYIDDKTMILTLQKDNYREEYPKSGDLRVDVALPTYKANIGIDIPVDFTESFNNVIEKDISGKIPEFDYTLNKLEANVMGTTIIYTEPKLDNDAENKSESLLNSSMILKIGDKMYKTRSRGNYSGKDTIINGTYEAKSVTYDTIKNEKNISIIPLICNISMDELDNFYSQNENKENSSNGDTNNNVHYEKIFNFADGSKGEIYNIERNDNSIKIYCKGESEKESLLMANNMSIHYQYIKDKTDNVFYDNNNMSFYKDPKESLGYIIEFSNVANDKDVDLIFNKLITQVDKYKLSDEIKLSN